MKKIIARISNGFGNQMFLYATAYSLSKKLNRKLELDIFSGLNSLRKKNLKKKFKHFVPQYELKYFNISSKIADRNDCFDTLYQKYKRKILLFSDNFLNKKNFIIEKRNENKISSFYDLRLNNSFLNNKVFIEGYFETEKYFLDYRNELINEFSLKNKINCVADIKNKILNTNSVSLAIRADRYNERFSDDNNRANIFKSKNYEILQYKYILRAIEYFKNKIKQPNFFIFSDNPQKIEKLFLNFKNTFIVNSYESNKIIEDYYLMSLCKHFAVSPTTFHFWPAWLSNYKHKICLRPKNLNPSNNKDFWPKSWIKI